MRHWPAAVAGCSGGAGNASSMYSSVLNESAITLPSCTSTGASPSMLIAASGALNGPSAYCSNARKSTQRLWKARPFSCSATSNFSEPQFGSQ